MLRKRKTRNIVRIVVGGQRGWQVKIARAGKRFCPYFSDSKFGGARGALKEAVRVRDLFEKDHPRPKPGSQINVLLPSNKTGIPGVQIRFLRGKRGRNKDEGARAIAQWCPKMGVVRMRSFSFEKFGRPRALKLAVKARRLGLKERLS